MGICGSCLGRRQRDDLDERPDDESPLLFNDPNNLHYSSFSQQQMNSPDDPLEVQREIEALQRVVARTSDNMVDIFEIAPQDADPTQATPAQYALPGEDARLARYQNLLSKLSAAGADDAAHPASLSSTASTKVDWVPWDEDNIELQHGGGGGGGGPVAPPLKAEVAGPLVGTFADAADVVVAGR